jgi:hypothetical protein
VLWLGVIFQEVVVRKSPRYCRDQQSAACAVCWCTAPTIIARTRLRSAAISGRRTFACPIWSRDLPARLAVGGARMCGRIGSRLKRMPEIRSNRLTSADHPSALAPPSTTRWPHLLHGWALVGYSEKAAMTKATINTATPAAMRASSSFGIVVNPVYRLNVTLRALNRHVQRVFNPGRKDHHWGRRKLARDG